MKKVRIDNSDQLRVVDASDPNMVMCCQMNGSACNIMCAAYSEDFRQIDTREAIKIAKCNAFNFTIGEL